MTFSFHKEAEDELLNQVSYYHSFHEELAQEFNLRVKETIRRILDFPNAWTKIDKLGNQKSVN